MIHMTALFNERNASLAIEQPCHVSNINHNASGPLVKDHVAAAERLAVAALVDLAEQGVIVRHVVSQLTTAALNVRRNDVADGGVSECHWSPLSALYHRRSSKLANASANIERLSCALVAAVAPGVEPLTLTAADLADLAARSRAAALSTAVACWATGA